MYKGKPNISLLQLRSSLLSFFPIGYTLVAENPATNNNETVFSQEEFFK